MSLLTRCPACTTVYKVVPDQLRISQGWVKCGQCGDVFDATLHLVQLPTQEPPTTGDTEQTVQVSAQSDPTASEIETIIHTDASEADSSISTGPAARAILAESDVYTPNALTESIDIPEAETSVKDDAGVHDKPTFPDQLSEVAVEQQTPELTEHVSFLKDAQAFQNRQHKMGRTALFMLACMLLLTLSFQWVYLERSRLSTLYPQWRLAIQNLCDVAGCSIPMLKQIESITIDAATFNKIDVNHYRLRMTIKNASQLHLALPSIELTLTDLQDQVLIRRVFSPHDFAAVANHLPPLSDWQVNVPVSVNLAGKETGVVGYRMLAFYP